MQCTSQTLTSASSEAVETLLVLMQPSVPAAVRLGASRVVLEIVIKLLERVDLIETVESVEAWMTREA